MIENNSIKHYGSAINSYRSLDMNSKLRGQLVEKDGKDLKLRLEDNSLLKIRLREDIQVNPNKALVIDRSNIEKSKLIDSRDDINLSKSEIDSFSKLLISFDLEPTEENISSLKKMDNLGIELSKENFNTYKIAKNSIEEIALSLDYETAILLEDLGIDIENDSIEKIASALREIRVNREGQNLLGLFDSPELSTEEAEAIASKIYGHKVGRDIIEIVKSLHRNDVAITRQNIDKIDSSFYKLHRLKDLGESDIIDAVRDELDINIDSLYRLKMYHSLNSTDKQAASIPNLLDENVMLEVADIRSSLTDVIAHMNYDSASLLIETSDIEKTDIRELALDIEKLSKASDLTLSDEAKIQTKVPLDLSSSLSSLASALRDIGQLEFDALALAIKKFSSVSLMDLQRVCSSSEYREIQLSHFPEANDNLDFKSDLSKAFARNGLEYSRPNIDRAVDIYRSYNNISNNASSDLISRLSNENIRLETMGISEASRYIDRYIQSELDYTSSKATALSKLNSDVMSVFKNGDNSSIMAMRGQELLSLSELKKADSLFRNNNQLGQKLSEISSIVSSEGSSESMDILNKMKEGILAIQRGLKASKSEVEINHQRLEETIEEIRTSSSLLSSEDKKLGESSSQASGLISESKDRLANDRILQLPVMLNDHLSNLNMYFKEKKNKSKSNDDGSFSAILSIDTESLGVLSMALDIENQSLSIKICTQDEASKSHMEGFLPLLDSKISTTEYALSQLDLESESEITLFEDNRQANTRLLASSNKLDIKI